MSSEIEKKIGEVGVVAVLVIDDSENAVPIAKTLLDNGISAMELTLRTDAAIDSLKRIKKEVPNMLAGVGTILTPEQIREVKACNAAFGVAPGYNSAVVEESRKIGLPFAPGISTPSEIEGALSQECTVFKYFHAEGLGGAKYLKNISAPYGFRNLKYIPLGGLTVHIIAAYLELPIVLAIGGSWIAPRELIHAQDWDTIGRNAAAAVKVYQEVRG